MNIKEIINELIIYQKQLNDYGGHFDIDQKLLTIKSLETSMLDEKFWQDKEAANQVVVTLNTLKKETSSITKLKDHIKNNLESARELEPTDDEEITTILTEELTIIKHQLTNLAIELLLDEPYDKNNAIIEIHSGAGGTESCDWANMLYRMYGRWGESKNLKVEEIDYQAGEEVGLKRGVLLIKGHNAYGYLKGEKGIHRLVRISPFDASRRRHTSFASVDIIPEFDDDIDIKINESDLKIDEFKSGGAGGQSVNTTDSAVRITHLPTKIIATCQNERSQIKNKEKALKILKNKLYQLELDKRQKETNLLRGEQEKIEFGSQIRSYVMHPYSIVKDHRTGYEIGNVDKVLDGELDQFMAKYFKYNKGQRP
ncbi:MAG: peptide chain release factor 2 [Bacilli bacterium]